MLKLFKLACVTGSLLLIYGCQSSSPPPAPEAWYMESYEPTLTQRMLNELSPSPTKAIKD